MARDQGLEELLNEQLEGSALQSIHVQDTSCRGVIITMIKIKAIPFILITAVLHIAASIANSINIVDCDIQTNCVSAATRIWSEILAFPLILVSWIWHGGDGSVSGASYLYLLVNSFLAATFVWLLVKPFLNRGGKQEG